MCIYIYIYICRHIHVCVPRKHVGPDFSRTVGPRVDSHGARLFANIVHRSGRISLYQIRPTQIIPDPGNSNYPGSGQPRPSRIRGTQTIPDPGSPGHPGSGELRVCHSTRHGLGHGVLLFGSVIKPSMRGYLQVLLAHAVDFVAVNALHNVALLHASLSPDRLRASMSSSTHVCLMLYANYICIYIYIYIHIYIGRCPTVADNYGRTKNTRTS